MLSTLSVLTQKWKINSKENLKKYGREELDNWRKEKKNVFLDRSQTSVNRFQHVYDISLQLNFENSN